MKRITIIVITAIIALGAIIFFIRFSGDDTDDKQADQEQKQQSPDHEKEDDPNTEESLDDIFSSAKQGNLPDTNIVVGETTADDVQEAWGEPNETTDTDAARFLNYPSHDTDVGITDDVVTDMRSSQEQVTSIDLDTVQSYKKPDDTSYYQDEDHDQIILVYELSDDYVLKWVLAKPNEDADNPDVDHISLAKEHSGDSGKDEKADDSGNSVAESMSLDEKIGQMIFSGVDGTEMTPETENIIEDYHVGGVILFGENIESTTQTVDLLNNIKAANANDPLPLLLGVDEEGGSVTRMPNQVNSLPTSRSIGDLNDSDVAFDAGSILGRQMQALGFNLDFAPVLDVNSNPDNPVIGDRSFGDNPNTVTKMGIQEMKGIQSEGIISVMKHFPGHGDTGEDSHLELPKVDKDYDELSQLELTPFKEAISEGADVNMISHILLPKVDADYPASMSKEVITNILREDEDFDGVVITDDLTMGAITEHYDVADATVQTVKAGGDLLLVAHEPDLIDSVFDKLKAAVEDGEISEDRIDESVERITDLKETYELSDEKTPHPDVQPINEDVDALLEKVS